MQIPEMEEKIQKKCFLFNLIAFELGVSNSCNVDYDICH